MRLFTDIGNSVKRYREISQFIDKSAYFPISVNRFLLTKINMISRHFGNSYPATCITKLADLPILVNQNDFLISVIIFCDQKVISRYRKFNLPISIISFWYQVIISDTGEQLVNVLLTPQRNCGMCPCGQCWCSLQWRHDGRNGV